MGGDYDKSIGNDSELVTKSTGRLGAEGNPIHEVVFPESSLDFNKSIGLLDPHVCLPILRRGIIEQLQRESYYKARRERDRPKFSPPTHRPQHFDSVFRFH